MKGGFVHRRHDDERDLFASLLMGVCHDSEFEPYLQTLTGDVLSSSANFCDEARLDRVSARINEFVIIFISASILLFSCIMFLTKLLL